MVSRIKVCHEQYLVFIPIRNKEVRPVTSADVLYSYWFSMKKIVFTSYVLFSSFDLDLNLNMRPATAGSIFLKVLNLSIRICRPELRFFYPCACRSDFSLPLLGARLRFAPLFVARCATSICCFVAFGLHQCPGEPVRALDASGLWSRRQSLASRVGALSFRLSVCWFRFFREESQLPVLLRGPVPQASARPVFGSLGPRIHEFFRSAREQAKLLFLFSSERARVLSPDLLPSLVRSAAAVPSCLQCAAVLFQRLLFHRLCHAVKIPALDLLLPVDHFQFLCLPRSALVW
jgi:hypothetical protein